MHWTRYRLAAACMVISLTLSGCTLPLIGTKKKAALQVNAEPKATLFINGEHVGQTPYYNEALKEGDVVLKLVSESTTTASSWEGKVKLTSGIVTAVARHLSLLEEETSGYILSMDPLTDKNKTSLTVITTPDKAIVTVDGEPKGFAPLTIDTLSLGDHTVVVSLPGFREEEMPAKLAEGYKLIATVQLARQPEEEKEATVSAQLDKDGNTTPTPTPKKLSAGHQATASAQLKRPYVTIVSKDIGWVRVRAEASTASDELTKVNDGESYPLLDTTPNGWYQIEYETDKEGWISGKYAEKYE